MTGSQPFGGRIADIAEPVRRIPGDDEAPRPSGTALCLSGGGYRAMLFHVGVLWRLNDAGRLPTLDRVSSVSGGSIAAGVLALHWNGLTFDATGVATNFGTEVVSPLLSLAGETIDVSSVVLGGLLPFTSVSDRIAAAYREHLFGEATLQDLPAGRPRFVLNATNLESGALMRFSRPYVADYRVGRILDPRLSLAVAVAASSAFPPVLSPCTLDLRKETWTTDPGNDLTGPGFRDEISLTDGGVYDNLGLETAYKRCRTLLVSDGSGRLEPDPDPPEDWLRHTVRVIAVMFNQVLALRKRELIGAYRSGVRDGTYVGIRSDVADYGLADPMPADPAVTAALAAMPTRLERVAEDRQEQLINWGYTIADTGLRAHVDPAIPKGTLPYPEHPVG